jgi:hypothetical protein
VRSDWSSLRSVTANALPGENLIGRRCASSETLSPRSAGPSRSRSVTYPTMFSGVPSYTGSREKRASRVIRSRVSDDASFETATTTARGTITSTARSPWKSIAREAISLALLSSDPTRAASSTSSWISSGESLASVKLVLSPKSLSTTLEAPVSTHTRGFTTEAIARSAGPSSSEYRSAMRSASDLGTSSPTTISRNEMPAMTTTSPSVAA